MGGEGSDPATAMWTGRETLRSIESAIGKLYREETELDRALRSAIAEAERLRKERAETLRELARVKLDEMAAGRLVDNLDAGERRAVQMLDEYRGRLARVTERREALLKEAAEAREARDAAAKDVEDKLAAVETLRADVEVKVQTDAAWQQAKAACDEANALGRRSIVHAQGPGGAKAAVMAGCTSIEHGNRLTDEVLDLMVKRGTYFDSNNHLLLHNYIENKDKYLGSGNFTEQGFAYMEKGLPIGNDTFKRALAKHVKMIFGTDGGAGAHGRNFEEIVYRVRDGGQPPMAAIVSATSLSAESLRMQNQIGSIGPGMEADIIATVGNPVDDITAVRRVAFVMKGGQVFKNEETR